MEQKKNEQQTPSFSFSIRIFLSATSWFVSLFLAIQTSLWEGSGHIFKEGKPIRNN